MRNCECLFSRRSMWTSSISFLESAQRYRSFCETTMEALLRSRGANEYLAPFVLATLQSSQNVHNFQATSHPLFRRIERRRRRGPSSKVVKQLDFTCCYWSGEVQSEGAFGVQTIFSVLCSLKVRVVCVFFVYYHCCQAILTKISSFRDEAPVRYNYYFIIIPSIYSINSRRDARFSFASH